MASPGGSDPRNPIWVADRDYGEMDNIQDLYLEASKGFNWVKQQENCLTSGGNLLVAAYYDENTRGLYLSTIPRSTWYNLMLEDKNVGQIWRAHFEEQGKKDVHAEDGAYFWREVKKNITPPEGTSPLDIFYGKNSRRGSKVAVWGETGSDATRIRTARGRPIPQCDECASFAEHMGVYIEPPQ
jgi:hypothetical protein